MSVEHQEETNLAQLGRVAMWIETARWSDAELTVVTQEEVMGWRFSQAHDAPPKQKHWKEYPGDAQRNHRRKARLERSVLRALRGSQVLCACPAILQKFQIRRRL
ncbi:hypothetical protein B0H14DRAFT_3488274 [Mycena olivaceomarginata]|nr:hypothetical protein B0H14DRAFT_3488274 [Mycena olivaceomarginata]